MRMHPTFTRVHQRSYDVFVGEGEASLEDLLTAFSVDPMEAEDAFEQFHPRELRRDLQQFASVSRVSFAWAIETVSQWASVQKSADDALQSIVSYSKELGVWCACQVARDSLRNARGRESGPLLAIVAAERWVAGQGSEKNCVDAAAEAEWRANSIGVSQMRDCLLSASSAAYAASGRFAKDSAKESVRLCARRAAGSFFTGVQSSEWLGYFNGELRRLCSVVADACFSFPVIP